MKYSLVLVEIEGGVNLGLICRLAENFEVDDIILVNPHLMDEDYDLADVFASRASRRLDNLIIARDLNEVVKNFDFVIATTGIRSMSPPYRSSIAVSDLPHALDKLDINTLAIIFGRESTGLTPDEIKMADLVVTIPTSERYPSMNLATAVAVVLSRLYEYIISHKSDSGKRSVDPEILKLIEGYVYGLAKNSFNRDDFIESAVLAIRRCILTSDIDDRDAKVILTLFRRLFSTCVEDGG